MLKDGRPRRNIQKSAAFRSLVAKGDFALSSPDAKHFYMAGLLDIAFEHHRAIGALLMLGMSSSALALLRTFIETSYRFIWLQTCASDQAVKKIANFSKNSFPDISRIISDLVRNSKLSGFKTELPDLHLLNDFTHSGAAHVLRRFQRVGKTDECFEQDTLLCVYHSDFVLLLIGILFYGTYGKAEHVETIQQEYLRLRLSYESPAGN
jgi:hypothetical protein